MTRIIGFIFLATCAATLPAATDLSTVHFIETGMTKAVDHPSHARVVVYFNGVDQNARNVMQEGIKNLAETTAKVHAPIQIICITPNLIPDALQLYAEGMNLGGVALGYEPLNPKNISLEKRLDLTYTPGAGGERKSFHWGNIEQLTTLILDQAKHKEIGQHRYKVEGLSQPQIIDLWWQLENGQPDAVKKLLQAYEKAKPDHPVGKQIIALHDAVVVPLRHTMATLVNNGQKDFSTYEALELAIKEAQGLDTSIAEDYLKTLGRESAIRGELAARKAFDKCLTMIKSDKNKTRDNGLKAMAQIAARMPETVYGKKAATYKRKSAVTVKP